VEGVATGALVEVEGGVEVVVVAGGFVVVVGGGAGACAHKTGSPGTSMAATHSATSLRGSLRQDRVRVLARPENEFAEQRRCGRERSPTAIELGRTARVLEVMASCHRCLDI